jgi:acyl-CoA thioesterase I
MRPIVTFITAKVITAGFMIATSFIISASAGVSHATEPMKNTILVFGDSLSAAYGLKADDGWVALLAERLKTEKFNYNVVNASISGETTAGGIARLPADLARHKPKIVVIELGANDGLRGLSIKQAQANLDKMVAASKKAGAKVLIIGMEMPPNFGPDYTKAFSDMFSDTAKKYQTNLVPFMFAGFGEKLEMFQADRSHPTKAAQPIMLNTIWPQLKPLLSSK